MYMDYMVSVALRIGGVMVVVVRMVSVRRIRRRQDSVDAGACSERTREEGVFITHLCIHTLGVSRPAIRCHFNESDDVHARRVYTRKNAIHIAVVRNRKTKHTIYYITIYFVYTMLNKIHHFVSIISLAPGPLTDLIQSLAGRVGLHPANVLITLMLSARIPPFAEPLLYTWPLFVSLSLPCRERSAIF